MTVLLTVSETAAGAELNDVLAGASTGLDLGQVVNGSYAPVIDQNANTGVQDVYIRHDAVIDPIENVSFYLGQFSGTYGGANTASSDLSQILAYGLADSGSSKNNTDGLSRGLHIDMDWQVSTTNQFLYSREATGQRRIFGKTTSGLNGSSLALSFPMHQDAASFWNGTAEVDATTPVAGKIGKASDTILGNRGHFKKRFYLHTAATEGGIQQWDFIINFSFTA